MIKSTDIQRAINLFKRWDNERAWASPNDLFINHTYKKAEDSLNTAKLLLGLMKNKDLQKKVLYTDVNSSLWIINASYYSMFFLAQFLLGRERKKLPEGTKDTHKTVFLAMMYYFLIKGSSVEGKKKIEWTDIKSSKISDALILFNDSLNENQRLFQLDRVKHGVVHLKKELDKRAELTYRTTNEIELEHAKISLNRAEKFWEITKEYVEAT